MARNEIIKWSCSVCTYENWPAAFKCTLCGTPRSSSLIEDEMQRMTVTSRRSKILDRKQTCTGPEATLIKCRSCTYLNQATSFKCEQCFQVLCDSPALDTHTSRQAATCSPTTAFSTVTTAGKWTCSQCTYENWPKSKHCVMCYASPVSSTYLDASNESEPKDISSSTASHSSSTTNLGRRLKFRFTQLPLTSRDRLWLSACAAVRNGEVTPVERYILSGGKIDRKLSKQECRYLNFQLHIGSVCPGNLNLDSNSQYSDDNESGQHLGDVPTVSSDPGSVLASVDCTLSNSGLRFRSGLTLVDLAIRFGRADLINLCIALSGLQSTTTAVTLGNGCRPALSCTNSPTSTILRNTHQVRSSQDLWSLNKSGQSTRRLTTPHAGIQIHPALQQLVTRVPNLVSKTRSKWMPCQASPHIAGELRNLIASRIKQKKGDFPCIYLSDWGTFALPSSIMKLPPPIKQLLLSKLCDTQAQSELDEDAKAINWWFIPGQKQASRLFALWNRTAGDCLLDSALQACWGVFDRENCLRRTLAETLRNCEANFYPRWRDYEALQAACHYILDEDQCQRDWANVLAAACQPREALEQIHIFALSHVLRRPIIVYGVKYIKNYRDEPIGIANFQGIYLPLLWERNLCSRNPIVLGYTRGHFTALVPMEPQISFNCPTHSDLPTESQLCPSTSNYRSLSSIGSVSSIQQVDDPPTTANIGSTNSVHDTQPESGSAIGITNATASPITYIYLPLVDRQGVVLPIHFTTEKEANMSSNLLRDWLDVVCTPRGLPLARLRLYQKHALVDRMVEDWLESYRSLAKLSHYQLPREHSSSSASISSDPDEEELGKFSVPESHSSSPI